MKFFPSRTTFLSIGNLTIQWYAICLLTGVGVAYYFARKNLKEYRNIDVNDFFDNIFIYMLWGGVIGARLWYCIFDANYNYLENPVQILKIWDGGLAIHGTLLGGALVCFFYCKKKGVSIYKFFDCVLPTVLIGQAIGRWGNFVNQECYGEVVDESYYNGILSFIKDSMYIKGAYREPMFLYESCLCLLGFILINFVLRKRENKRGDLVWAYLMWYGTIRFFIEGHRTDSLMISFLNLKTAQVTSIIFVVVGVLGYLGVIDKLVKVKKPTLIFDLDGTLIDSKPAIIKSFTDVFEKYDKSENFTPERQIEVLGPALKDSLGKFFPNENIEEVLNTYRQAFKKNAELVKPMPGAIETLTKLKEEGYDMGIVTTRENASTKACLEMTGLKDYFKDFVGINDVSKIKPDIEAYELLISRNKLNKADLIVIGDSAMDVEGGKNYGAYTVAYVSEPAKKEAIDAAGPNEEITDFTKILDIVKEKHYFTYNLK